MVTERHKTKSYVFRSDLRSLRHFLADACYSSLGRVDVWSLAGGGVLNENNIAVGDDEATEWRF